MYLKSISNLNLKATPVFSDACNNYKSWKSIINESLPEKIGDNDLVISCVQEVYGYRTGIFGYLFSILSMNKKFKTNFIVNYLNKHFYKNNNLLCSDSFLLSVLISYINSFIPFLNYGVYDFKDSISNNNIILKYKNKNDSIPGMFNYSESYYDSGCCIFSNKEPYMSGYEPLEYYNKVSVSDKIAKKGIVWSFFKDENKGILVITFNLSDDIDDLTKLLELNQIMTLHKEVKNKFVGSVNIFESFICGDCKFNYSNHTFSDLSKNFKIINNSTNYLFYQHDEEYLLNINITNENTRVFSGEVFVKEKIKEDEVNDNDVYVNINEIENEKESEKDEIKEEIIIEEVDIEVNEDIKDDDENKSGSILPFLKLNNYFRSRLSPSSASSSSSNDEWTKI